MSDLSPLFKEIAQGGILGALTLVVFFIARRDYLMSSTELLNLYKDSKEDKTILVNLVRDHTVAVTSLTKAVEHLERRGQ